MTKQSTVGPGLGSAAIWIGLYASLAAAPLVFAAFATEASPRGFWGDFSAGLGFVALAVLSLQFLLTARFRFVAPRFGLDILLHFHRQAGLVAFSLVVAHPLIFFADDPDYRSYLDPAEMGVHAVALWVLLLALVLIIGLTLLRRRIRLAYEYWRLTHGMLGVLIVAIGVAHVIEIENYVTTWKSYLWMAMTGGALALLIHARVVKPLIALKKPYEVVSVTPERGHAWSVTLAPAGHAGMKFEAGQFGWLGIGNTPFSLQQHPFSFSSSAARSERVTFTIKALGDRTARIGEVQPGARAYLEGPYGAFKVDPAATELVFVAGGVGITPIMSILRTLQDTADRRPCTLVYANVKWDDVLFREALEAIEGLTLRVVHVLEAPPADWKGPTGRLSAGMLREILPKDHAGLQYLTCGPDGMMNTVSRTLREAGVAVRRIQAERFNIA